MDQGRHRVTTYLLADIGGTNARFALARDGTLDPASIAYFRNDEYSDFTQVLAAYLEQMAGADIKACCVAMAGQIAGDSGVLTNRPWTINSADIARLTGCRHVTLINDLYAIGRSLARLGAQDVSAFYAPAPGGVNNGQRLVVNIGTGFNIAFVMAKAQQDICARAEAGHFSLPLSIAAQVRALVGENASGNFPTIEQCFSGRGLSNLHAAATGQQPQDCKAILAEAETSDANHPAQVTMTAYADMLATLLRELTLLFLPQDGIYLVGGVATGVLQGRHRAKMQSALAQRGSDAVSVAVPPVTLITSNNAGLLGCLAVLDD